VEKFEKIKIRTLTIIIGLPVVFYIIQHGGMPFNLTVVILAILGSYELCNIIKNIYNPSCLIGMFASIFFLFKRQLLVNYTFEGRMFFLLIIMSIFIRYLLIKDKKFTIINIAMTLFISVYIGYFLSFLIELRSLNYGNLLLIFVLTTTWINDTIAYIIGISYGKNHIFPKISPNKTLEGSIGGIIGGAVGGAAFCFLIPFNPLILFILGFLAAAFGQVGDLFESMIKRNFNIKDSGKLIPGHGGILDCMDSILFSVPLLYFCFYMILNNFEIL